jgi:Legume lectin domain/Chitobiase/beta-hexosaminidase C-terminal domain/NHL repeat
VTFTGAVSPVNFGTANLCAAGASTPAPCSNALALTYKVTASGTLGTPKVLTQGSPNLDYMLAAGSTCSGHVTAGATCAVNVSFTPINPGTRPGAVQIVDENEKVLATTYVTGFGAGPKLGFDPGVQDLYSTTPYIEAVPQTIPLPNPLAGTSVTGVAVDGAEDIFVSYSNEVIKFAAGSYVSVVLPFSGLSKPAGLAMDGAGNLFVADEGNARVLELPAGSHEQVTLPFTGLAGPAGVAVDNKGDVYVADPAGNKILELTANGTQRALPFTSPDTPSDSPAGGIAVDAAGTVYVSYPYSIVGLPAGSSSEVIEAASGSYTGVAVDATGDLFYAIQGFRGEIEEQVPGGGSPIDFALGTSVYGTDLTNPLSLAISRDGNIFLGTGSYQGSSGELLNLQRSQSAALGFGYASTGQPNSGTPTQLTITNLGTSAVTANTLFSNNQFSTPDASCLASILPQGLCNLVVSFQPTAGGTQDGYLTLATNGPNSPAVKLLGTGVTLAPFMLPLGNNVYPGPQSVYIGTFNSQGGSIYYTTDGTVPTTSSTLFTGAITVNSTETISAIVVYSGVPSPMVSQTFVIAPTPPAESVSSTDDDEIWPTPNQANGNGSTVFGPFYPVNPYDIDPLRTGSDFYSYPLSVDSFTTEFVFATSSDAGDGLTFTIQNEGTTALGNGGSGLGYQGIGHSVAVKLDVKNDQGEGSDSIGLYINGASPTVPSIDLTGTGINLGSGDSFQTLITYDGHNLLVSLTDLTTLAAWTHAFPVDIPSTVGSHEAYFGFTGSNAGAPNSNALLQSVSAWSYISGAPTADPLPLPVPPVPSYAAGLSAVSLTTNGDASIGYAQLQTQNALGGNPGSQNVLLLTDGSELKASSAFFSKPVNVQSFHTNFTFQLSGPVYFPGPPYFPEPPTEPSLSTIADGFTFTIQNMGPKALGALGGGLGYASIGKSVAVKFDLHSNAGEGSNSTGVYVNGEMPTMPSIDLDGTAIDLHSGDPIVAEIDYDGAYLKVMLTDTFTNGRWTSAAIPVDIPATVGGDTAYVGFTGGTGARAAVEQIVTWTFTNP